MSRSATRGRGTTRPVAADVVDLVLGAGSELFHCDDQAYVTVPVNGHRETYGVDRRAFAQWCRRTFHERHGRTVSAPALADARATIESRALFDHPKLSVHRRVGGGPEVIYIDLGDEAWTAAKVTATGWELLPHPVKFVRAKGMHALPHPITGGHVDELRRFINVGDGGAGEARWALVLAWLCQAFLPAGPYPILVLHGEQGSAKTSTAKVLRSLIDPSMSPLRAEPASARDLMISACNSWCLGFDNVSHLTSELSDGLCRLATGGGFSTRELHTDSEETIFDAQRPVILTGISELATRSDLLSRCLILDLPRLESPIPEATILAEFDEARPRLIGALLSALARGLARLPDAHAAGHSRLPDFCRFAVAVELGLGRPAGTFERAYEDAIAGTHQLALESAPVAGAIREFASTLTHPWCGTASELLELLGAHASEALLHRRGWPATPKALADALRRLAPDLREVGIEVDFRPTRLRREITLTTSNCVASVAGVASNTRTSDARGPGATQGPGLATLDHPGPERDARDAGATQRGGVEGEQFEYPRDARDAGDAAVLFFKEEGKEETGDRPSLPCGTCGSDEWWRRPLERGGGWVCGRCHPDPATLVGALGPVPGPVTGRPAGANGVGGGGR